MPLPFDILNSCLGREAGDVYLKAAETEIKSGEADGSARKFLNASTCYKKIDPERNIKVIYHFSNLS